MSEPPEELEDGDCEDVGVAFVSVRDILQNRKDVTDADVPSEFICQVSRLMRYTRGAAAGFQIKVYIAKINYM